ncbi:hypothetical protein [Bradyrhizobium sp.]|uniref:hypothetical protein n=1 Tax=Bradyrhizobium sp. TaxID=376 RepID=UPI003C7938EE
MLKIAPALPGQWRQLAGFAILALVAAAAARALDLRGVGSFFEPYFAGFSSASVFGATAVIGVISLRVLQASGWFGTRQRGDPIGVGVAAVLATLFAISVVTVDRFVGIKVINVPMPWSLLFYPTVALVVEVFFHTMPLALMFASLRSIARSDSDRVGWVCIIVVSLLEPAYQLRFELAGRSLSWLDTYVWTHVWAINLVQLYLLRRFGFASMYGMRLVYYFDWHIVWGYLR